MARCSVTISSVYSFVLNTTYRKKTHSSTMASKISLAFLAVIVVFYVMSWETQATIVRRDAPPEKNAAQSIDEAFQSLKQGIDNFVKKVEDNELVRNITAGFKSFGESVQKKGEEIVNKLKADAPKV
ncbi:uncharacterized protein [Leptinotarsa decemlineata]|uniref:uncharacterized protein n=1 Tax=Leptinotarsa decemlineata TaxID=7539 RepID=UPI003D3051B6